ncbi:MAG: CusA/CzcA family heavy metal efflux RND transporter [Nitrosomonas sp.]|uniref:efflux RND transporter permease subunit n=1 Tax=Nitrosomonas sp. TaxID=42353 RepID=UPI0027305D2A|nr:CusA/CzcA family heavy metal efflux RND transporter [Nitrosomonas sp.]MDP1787598.1 CusA/CzcA family heavy metal efflux RND transporter [Nitrosomonas sp.]MDP3662500.1 CusA/CzcA family heavy metal efflux RND transporter [Nitrosomonas sp.]MDZ4106887.1 CusA/CzcA family heavy metal efflux RND transporter [Nitrosomonas sp.]
MIENLIEFCARNRLIVFLLVFGAATAGLWAMKNTPIDALPDLSDTQVIIYSKWMGRSPDLVEDQITYPIVTALLSAPNVTVVRGFSDFGFSYVYVLFKEGTDIYWARSRVLEYMNQLSGKLPEGVAPQLGPDATAVGWVFQYALVDESGQQDLASLRSFQDWYLRYWLAAVDGVAEVASVGGFVRQYQINLDPTKVLAYKLNLNEILDKIRMSNLDVGGRVVEFSGIEYMIRGRGYIKSTADIEKIAVGVSANGTPILLRDVASVGLGPDMRRGIVELNGQGETVGGVVVMRYGEDVSAVIERVNAKLKEIEPSLPKGVKIVAVYDRSNLIHESIATATENLIEELVVISVLIVGFLLHLRSALIPIITLPLAVLIAFIPMYYLGVGLNIMAIGGIIVALGDMVDASIVMVDNAHRRLEEWERNGRKGDREQILIDSAKEVGPPIFASLLVIAIAFMPVFVLEAQEGRLFTPLALTKILAIAMSAVLAVTLIPALLSILIRGRIIPEQRHPVTRLLQRIYAPLLALALRYRWSLIVLSLILMASIVIPLQRIGSEFMPPLYEGTILYMPTTLPGISVTEAGKLLQQMDQKLKSFPEVELVFGKAGRADTSTDPAPFSMMEVLVELKPKEQWRKDLSYEDLITEMDQALQFPGVTNTWSMPIKARLDMLTTGVRTPVGIKIFGPDLKTIETIGKEIEMVAKDVPGTRSVYAERVSGGYYLDININRDEIARYGFTVMDVSRIIESGIGGENITTTIEGRERYPINLRYQRELRDDLDKLGRLTVSTPNGAQVPLAQLVELRMVSGPAMIRDEDGMLSGYVYVDMADRDMGSFVEDLKQVVRDKIELPPGYILVWSGQYEFMERVKERLKIFVPLTLAIIFLLYYFTFRSVAETLMVMLGVPLSLVGGIWALYWLNYNMSIAVWVGLIALAGVAAETSAIMLSYLDGAVKRRRESGQLNSLDDLLETVKSGAMERIRPVMMTGLANIVGLMPVMLATGVGADVMKRLAAPMIGGVGSALLLTLFVIPAIYVIWRWHTDIKYLADKT